MCLLSALMFGRLYTSKHKSHMHTTKQLCNTNNYLDVYCKRNVKRRKKFPIFKNVEIVAGYVATW